jgi:hypothetical protein
MKIVITKEQYQILQESFKKREEDKIATAIRDSLKLVYQPKGKWGVINEPDNNCETGEGVIGVYPHLEGIDNWSILNRFDTNSLVRNRLKEIYTKDTNNSNFNNEEFIKWLLENKEKLFDGEYTQELVDLNKSTVDKGNRNEQFAIDVLKTEFPNSNIKRFCSGDKRDTRMGMDIAIESEGDVMFAQVKSFESVKHMYEPETGKEFYMVKAYFNHEKYSETNVQFFFFVNFDKGEYVLFQNIKSNIQTSGNQKTLFLENPLLISDNLELGSEPEERVYRQTKNIKKQKKVKDIFKTSNKKLDNLIKKRELIDKLIAKELENLKTSQ